MAKSNLAETLFGTYRRRVLGLLLLHPEQSYYVREIARLTDIPPGSLHRELRNLADAEILLRQPLGNQVRYQANRDCPGYEDLAGFFRKTSGLADVLREALSSLEDQIQLAFIFGSVAQGKEDASSDIDMLIIGNTEFADAVVAMAHTRDVLGREVNCIVMAVEDFVSKVQHNDPFVTGIVAEPKIYLVGASDVLAKLTQNRSAQGTRD